MKGKQIIILKENWIWEKSFNLIFQFTKRTNGTLDMQSLIFNACTAFSPLHLKLAAWFYVKDNIHFEGNIKGYMLFLIVSIPYKMHKTISETNL